MTKTGKKGQTSSPFLGLSRDEWSVNSITFAYSTKKTVAVVSSFDEKSNWKLLYRILQPPPHVIHVHHHLDKVKTDLQKYSKISLYSQVPIRRAVHIKRGG